MNEKIEKIINDWDPIDLFPMAPRDEYSQEINKIVSILELNKNIDFRELALNIKTIFENSFGEEMLFKNNEDEVAKKILESIK
ncbi:DUF1871 family protein [Enterococcus rivorum]|uniref:DUF1871 domain-containing protein n=1 Tax=Enterococcus rivorum TaxID=762845 RepID=A0A1E5KZ24_9ENTE|nr:DUF1871 family protein [Enterococcus rivorum]MBP2097701.1 hypothetical protein [Enterococcus rivorum]OEH83136.1 hypothetical protein BCR26_02385 [Enterococcus rivorum]